MAIAHRLKLFKNTTFRKPALLPSSGNEAPNVVDPVDQDILITGSTMLGASLPEDGSSTGLRNLVFFKKSFRQWTESKKKEKEKGDYVSDSSTTVKALQC